VIDGQVCVEEPYDAIREGRGMAAPLLLGNTVDEFPAEPAVQSRDELLKLARDLCGEKSGVFIETLENAGGATLAGALHVMKRAARVNGLEFAARLLAQGYKARHVESPLYYYEFAADIPGWDNPGCFHSVDIWFFFETLAKCWRPWKGSHYELARQMCNYWANFIRSGDPNGTDADGSALPEWTPFSEDAPSTMVFSNKSECREIAPGAVMKLLLDARKALMK
jgi:para-nitrobenzyl esterase